jgi:glucose/arabinose dehydrogenase
MAAWASAAFDRTGRPPRSAIRFRRSNTVAIWNSNKRRTSRYRPPLLDALEGRSLLSGPAVPITGHSTFPSDVSVAMPPETSHRVTSRVDSGLAALSRRDQTAALVPAGGAANVVIRDGYRLVPVATGLDFPTAVATGPMGRVWVAESGFMPPLVPRVLQINRDGSAVPVLSGDQLPAGVLEGPLTDVTYFRGWLWITHRQKGANGWDVGAISRFRPRDPVGTFQTVLTDLPSTGDHYTEQIVFDRRGRAYFSQGTATNSSVVGPDNALPALGSWLLKAPTFHDFPAVAVALSGASYPTPPNPMGLPLPAAVTSPFRPFGSGPAAPGTVVPGASPASPQEGIIAGNGAVYSFDPFARAPAATLRLEGWGFRNPYGIGFDPFRGRDLFVSNNGADVRGSRPIDNDLDDLFALRPGSQPEFFGWPDFFHDPRTGAPLSVTDPRFATGGVPVRPALDPAFTAGLQVQPALAELDFHSSANKFDFSASRRFGAVGDLFIAETGAFVPITGAAQFAGYKIVRVDPRTGRVSDFLVHPDPTPAGIFDPAGFNKPIDVRFRGDRMFIVDFGVLEPGLDLMQPNTGKLWVVVPSRSR